MYYILPLAYPHLILDNLNTKIGKRIFRIIQALFPIPKIDTRRIMTFKNENDFISFRHHTYSKEKGQIVLKENGPRFEMQPFEVSI
jgi:U3 small nucleolar ribonucleoprotein protein IMP4